MDPDGTSQHFIDRFRERISCIPELSDKIQWDEYPLTHDIDMEIDIPKLAENGFDINILLLDYNSIMVSGGGCVVEFFLSDKPKSEQYNREQVDRAIALVYGLLGPDYRVRTRYRGGEAYKGRFEKMERGKWKTLDWTRRLWLRHFFAKRTEIVLQNRVTKAT